MFSMQSVSRNPLIATFQLSSGASLNLEWSQNGVIGNGLNTIQSVYQFRQGSVEPQLRYRNVNPLPDDKF